MENQNMSRNILTKIFGYLMISTSIIGLIISSIGIIMIWRIQQPLLSRLSSDLDLAIFSLDATANGLSVATSSLQIAKENSGSIQNTLKLIGKSIDDTSPVVNSLNELLSGDLPQTIATTQISLKSAQSSAEIIDNVLRGLTVFIPGVDYRPVIPLHQSLANVSKSLDGIPQVLINMGSNIDSTEENLDLIEFNLIFIADQVDKIEVSLTEAETVLEQYQDVVSDLTQRAIDIQENLPIRIRDISIVITLGFVWIGMTQIGLLFQGIILVNQSKHQPDQSKFEESIQNQETA